MHKAFTEGRLEVLTLSDIISHEIESCRGLFVRFGAYGEPILLGEENVKSITEVASSFTGYTHQWRMPNYQWASKYFMASADTEKLMTVAHDLGWRTFRVLLKGDEKTSSEVTCPASAEGGRKVTCNVCGLCKGTQSGAKSISIIKH